MKISNPPYIPKEVLQKALERADDPGVLDAAVRENRRYVHWDEIYRRKKYPVDPHILWALMKFFRKKDARLIPFADTTFLYVLDDSCWEELHILDKIAAGNLSRILDPVGPDRDQYVVNATMEEAIASARLGGADISRRFAKDMLRERRKAGTHDERMVLNSYRTMNEVRTMTGGDLTPDLIIRLHAIMTAGTLEDPDDEVRFRENDDVKVTDSSGTVLFTPPSYKEVPRLIDELCRFVNYEQEVFIHPVVKGIIMHFLLAWIHPFRTGNGRCARALFYWYVAKLDYRLFEYMTISRAIRDTKGQYQKSCLYTRSDENDLTYFIRYNLGIFSNAIREMENYIREKQEGQREVLGLIKGREDLTVRQADILRQFMKHPEKPFRTREIMETYKIANATARTDLFCLADLGFIRKEKSGRELVFLFMGMKGKG
jgi:Fic family protein